MKHNYIFSALLGLFLCTLVMHNTAYTQESINASQILKGKRICIDPGHGDTAKTDHFRVGPAGEREEWINLRIGLLLKSLLEQAGAEVFITRTTDKFIELKDRADVAIKNKCNIFVSIHHNGTDQDPGINFPLVYYYKDAGTNPASIDLAKILLRNIQKELGFPKGYLFSDWTIYPNSGTAVLRYTYPVMPGVIGEASYFTNPTEEQKLKDPEYNKKEAKAYFDAIVEYFQLGIPNSLLIEPEPGQALSERRPSIRFQLTDGTGHLDINANSIRVLWNGQSIGKSYKANTGVVTILPTEFTLGDQTVELFVRNKNGQASHPHLYILKTTGALATFLAEQKKLAESKASKNPISLTLEQVQPKPDKLVESKNPVAIFKIKETKPANGMDSTSLETYLNFRKFPITYDARRKQFSVRLSGDTIPKKQTLEFFSAKDTSGRDIIFSPSRFTLVLSSATTAKADPKDWMDSYLKGKELVEKYSKDTTNPPLTDQDKQNLLTGIDFLTRTLQLVVHSEVSGDAQYLVGVAFEKLGNEPYYREQALEAYTKARAYYPTFDSAELAHTALQRLKSPPTVELEVITNTKD